MIFQVSAGGGLGLASALGQAVAMMDGRGLLRRGTAWSQGVHLAPHSGRCCRHSARICRDDGKHVMLPGVSREHLLGMGRERGRL